jgi:glutamyl-tRNA synthetase
MDKDNTEKIVTRFAPSPTGFPHLGTAMYAILNYLYARQNNGKVLMRSEDTDPVRSKPEYEKAIIDGLAWLGIKADEFYRQSDRLDIYKKYIAKMIADGAAYISTDTNEKGETRDVVRFKNPNKVITFHDSSRGDISVDTTDLKDFIIARDVNSPLYHLTVVVDDHETGVTHIIRGEDGLANTPRQILIQEAIGAKRPVYAHYPFIMLSNRTKMGKRNGAKSIQDYMQAGYLPEAIVNFIILMAWHPKDDREIFTIHDLIHEFQLERIGKSGAILDEVKLDWLNKEHIRLMPVEKRNAEILTRLKKLFPDNTKLDDESFMEKIYSIVFDRINKWSDIDTMYSAEELQYFFDIPDYPAEILAWKESSKEDSKMHLNWVLNTIKSTDDDTFNDAEKIKGLIFDYATEKGRGSVLWPLRVSLSGKEKSPDPFTLLSILGKEESLNRIENAIKKL